MEMKAANISPGIFFFAESQATSTNKNAWKKANSVTYKKTYRNHGKCPPSNSKKVAKFVTVKFPLKLKLKFQLWLWRFYQFMKITQQRNNTNVYLKITEWLASPSGTKFLKPIEEMWKGKLNVRLKCYHTSARNRASFRKVHQWNP